MGWLNKLNNVSGAKVFFLILTITVLSAVILANIGDPGYSGIQVDNYYSGNGHQGITQNISFNDSDGNQHNFQFEDGLLVDYSSPQPYIPTFPSGGIVSYYKLDNTTGSVYDMTGLSDGTNMGATRGVAGKINNSFFFNGSDTDDKVNFTLGQAYLFDTNDFTINAWFNFNDYNSYKAIYGYYAYDAGIRAVNIYLDTNNYTHYSLNDGNNSITYTSSIPLTGNTWYMITLAKNSTGALIYLNGTLQDYSPQTLGNLSAYSLTSAIGEIERSNHARDSPFNGKIDEVGIWNRTLNSTEISDLYNGGDGIVYALN